MVQVILLGVLQGLTEFLPVSSSAHLVFAEAFLGIQRPGVFLEVLLHLGTLVAVVVAFRQDIVKITIGFFQSLRSPGPWASSNPHPFGRIGWCILIGSVPTGLMGLLFEGLFERIFASVSFTAVLLLVTGVILMGSARRSSSRGLHEAGIGDALVIGLAQGLAIAPGISRSGITIAAGLWRGLDREAAARFSFLLAIPAILGAGLYKARDLALAQALGFTPLQLLLGFAASAVTGYLAIHWLLAFVRRARLSWFAYYCWAAGLAVLAYTWLR